MEDKAEHDFNQILQALRFGKKWKIRGKNGFLVEYLKDAVYFIWDEESETWTITLQKIVK